MFKKRKQHVSDLEDLLMTLKKAKVQALYDKEMPEEVRKPMISAIDARAVALICATAEYAWMPINIAVAIAVSVIITAVGFILF